MLRRHRCHTCVGIREADDTSALRRLCVHRHIGILTYGTSRRRKRSVTETTRRRFVRPGPKKRRLRRVSLVDVMMGGAVDACGRKSAECGAYLLQSLKCCTCSGPRRCDIQLCRVSPRAQTCSAVVTLWLFYLCIHIFFILHPLRMVLSVRAFFKFAHLWLAWFLCARSRRAFWILR